MVSPRWDPQGDGVWFLAADKGTTWLCRAPLDGTAENSVRRLVGNVGSGTSAYGGGATFSLAKTRAYAVTYTRPDVPGEIAVSD